MKGRHLFISSLLGLSFSLVIGGLYLIFLYVPTEETMGIVQRIFYFHVPVAWITFLAFFVIFLCSIMYLWKRHSKWDIVASSSAEVGILFGTLTLVTGSIWAKPIWGVWWTWEPRLTTALILWFIYIAYHIVRSFAGDEYRAARFSAIVGIVGFIDVPICFIAITLWRTQHPGPVIFEGGLVPSMLFTLLVCVAAFTTLYIILLIELVAMRNHEIEIKSLQELYN